MGIEFSPEYLLGIYPFFISYSIYVAALIRSCQTSCRESQMDGQNFKYVDPPESNSQHGQKSFRSAVSSLIIESARKNLIPGAFICSLGCAIVIMYYLSPEVQMTFDKIAMLQKSWGILFPIVFTSLFGGILPSLFLWLRGMLPAPRLLNLGYAAFCWGQFGASEIVLYLLQATLFGEEASTIVVVKKTIFDQFLAVPLVYTPNGYIWLNIPQYNYSIPALVNSIANWKKFAITICGQQAATMLVWIPAKAIVYSLPVSLQIACFNVLVMFFSMLMHALHGKAAADEVDGKAKEREDTAAETEVTEKV
eukprot:gnl/MRDRNA2_/MRDRNA2_57668_c0_seq1.p1 gnl/MRDRNA2_/MRDRNA2_57668_c0~~gnl/MRDRNA2_/MRDRNA2_57668_c0_seq1.p1  ORF type:complete len:308 (-),score=46.15 gnl/MRDRNA2_/MRDRNA2_57668_c0_seq1:14-937(-)